jgi:adenylate cyclase
MVKQFDYTTLAQRYTARFPALTYVGTQVNFWILANIVLVTILNLYANIIREVFKIPTEVNAGAMLLMAVILGFLYGLGLGFFSYHADRTVFRALPLGKVLLFKTFISVALVALMLLLLRFVFFELLIASSVYPAGISFNKNSWDYLFTLLMVYYFFMTLVISFINQVNRKYGPGVLLPLLLGRYRMPKEEERIFMFMDLKASTSIAERLGHLEYSSFIQDCFMDINAVLFPFCAQVYQYVGDEIVLTWPATEGLRNHFCIRFYFACKKQFQVRAPHYLARYGCVPVFKAGMHIGKVTVVEIGDIKKDIAYHGDTLNVSARIQSVCNEYHKDFLVSDALIEKIGVMKTLRLERLGLVLLKGKTERVGITSVDMDWISQ